jgi:hypothetical protein
MFYGKYDADSDGFDATWGIGVRSCGLASAFFNQTTIF